MTDKTRTYAEGIEFTAEIPDEFEEILTPEAVAFVAKLSREYRGRVDELLAKRAERQERINAGEMPDFLPETQGRQGGRLEDSPDPRRPAGQASRAYGTARPQDDHKRAQLGGELMDGRLRGRQLPDLAQHAGEPAQHERGYRRHHHLRRPRIGQALRAERRHGRNPGEAPRLAPLREAHARGRGAGPRWPLRLRALLLPQRQDAPRQRLAALTSTCPRWRATSRPGSGTTSSIWRRTS